jgi:hypothetical protein
LGGFVRPAQLPPDTGDFAGRTRLVAELEAMLTGPSGGTGTRLVSIAGMAGAGKTALMIRVGHRIRPCFPDGQFHAELGGSTEEPADPGTVLSGFLRATGLTDRQLPHRVAERSQLFRSWTAERAILVVLDDAVDLPHIQPLLPAGPHCAVLISSRLRLAGLPGLRTVELDVPDIEECLELLGYLIGPDRLHAEPEAARTIVHLCGQNPLAIRATAARLMVNPRYPLRRIVNRLADPSARLRVIGFGDLDPRARLTPAFRRLSMAARWMLHSLTRLGDTTFTPVAAAKLIAVDPATADVLIEELMDTAFLRAADLDEWGALTFRMPDLIRSFVLTVSEPEELAGRGADGSVSNRYTLPNGAWLLGNVAG